MDTRYLFTFRVTDSVADSINYVFDHMNDVGGCTTSSFLLSLAAALAPLGAVPMSVAAFDADDLDSGSIMDFIDEADKVASHV